MPHSVRAPNATVESSGNDWSAPPTNDQLEFTLFGPGFGECALIHVGGDHWLIVDSCQSPGASAPAALDYLSSLGRDPARCVNLVLATHWHDDHIKGLATLVESCSQAMFACSAALVTKEFDAMVRAFDGQRMIRAGSGVREINRVFNILQDRPTPPPRYANAGRPLLHLEPVRTSHGRAVDAVALSPSDYEHQLSLAAIGRLMPAASQTQRRCPREEPNLMSVALHIAIGETSFLLGADLEQHADPRRGWAAVLADTTLPNSPSIIFKVPHHGSAGSDSPDLWQQRLHPFPLALMTPWVRGAGRLPTQDDVQRITSRTPHAFITAPSAASQSPTPRPSMVQRQLREMGARIQRRQPAMGAVRFRNGGGADWNAWTVALLPPALSLATTIAA